MEEYKEVIMTMMMMMMMMRSRRGAMMMMLLLLADGDDVDDHHNAAAPALLLMTMMMMMMTTMMVMNKGKVKRSNDSDNEIPHPLTCWLLFLLHASLYSMYGVPVSVCDSMIANHSF